MFDGIGSSMQDMMAQVGKGITGPMGGTMAFSRDLNLGEILPVTVSGLNTAINKAQERVVASSVLSKILPGNFHLSGSNPIEAIQNMSRSHEVSGSLPRNLPGNFQVSGSSPIGSAQDIGRRYESSSGPIQYIERKDYELSGQIGGNYHVLDSMRSRQDPLMNFSWFCTMPAIDGIRLPWFYVEEFVAPFRSFQVNSRFQQGKIYHYAGQQDLSNINLKIYDDSSGKAGAYLEAWRGAVSTYDGIYNYPVNYKKTIEVVILDITRTIQVYKLRYEGCWPTTTEAMNLSSGASDRLIQGQEFSVDNIKITVANLSASELSSVIFSSQDNFPQNLMERLSGIDTVSGPNSGLFSTGMNAVSGFGRQFLG